MRAGMTVRYRQEFLSSYSGIGCYFSEIADLVGEIVELGETGKVVRVRWRDGRVSSSLVKSIEPVSISIPQANCDYQSDLLRERLALLLNAKERVIDAWRKLP